MGNKKLTKNQEFTANIMAAIRESQFAKQIQQQGAGQFAGSSVGGGITSGGDFAGKGNLRYAADNGMGFDLGAQFGGAGPALTRASAFMPMMGGDISLNADRRTGRMGQEYMGAQFEMPYGSPGAKQVPDWMISQ
jgi:hypothetical protein